MESSLIPSIWWNWFSFSKPNQHEPLDLLKWLKSIWWIQSEETRYFEPQDSFKWGVLSCSRKLATFSIFSNESNESNGQMISEFWQDDISQSDGSTWVIYLAKLILANQISLFWASDIRICMVFHDFCHYMMSNFPLQNSSRIIKRAPIEASNSFITS